MKLSIRQLTALARAHHEGHITSHHTRRATASWLARRGLLQLDRPGRLNGSGRAGWKARITDEGRHELAAFVDRVLDAMARCPPETLADVLEGPGFDHVLPVTRRLALSVVAGLDVRHLESGMARVESLADSLILIQLHGRHGVRRWTVRLEIDRDQITFHTPSARRGGGTITGWGYPWSHTFLANLRRYIETGEEWLVSPAAAGLRRMRGRGL